MADWIKCDVFREQPEGYLFSFEAPRHSGPDGTLTNCVIPGLENTRARVKGPTFAVRYALTHNLLDRWLAPNTLFSIVEQRELGVFQYSEQLRTEGIGEYLCR